MALIGHVSSALRNGNANWTGWRYTPCKRSGAGDLTIGDLAMSRSIGQPLPDDAADRAIAPLNIVDAKADPVVVTEIEFREVAV